jgi:hypothetical protein
MVWGTLSDECSAMTNVTHYFTMGVCHSFMIPALSCHVLLFTLLIRWGDYRRSDLSSFQFNVVLRFSSVFLRRAVFYTIYINAENADSQKWDNKGTQNLHFWYKRILIFLWLAKSEACIYSEIRVEDSCHFDSSANSSWTVSGVVFPHLEVDTLLYQVIFYYVLVRLKIFFYLWKVVGWQRVKFVITVNLG